MSPLATPWLFLLGCTGPVAAEVPGEVAVDPFEVLATSMRTQVPGFTVVVERPYVVAGDGTPAEVERRARQTVRWAHAQLRSLYFDADPPEPVAVWLFADDDSYVRHVEAWLGDSPDTPYGFANDDGLFMNISTGGGTLVHEMVHPLIAANVPGCPPWFNEGLASLYEASGERDGRIVGLLNWRLPGLQEGLRKGTAPSLTTLMALDTEGFYEDPHGTHYGVARYLVYRLQEEGVLERYFDELVANLAQDPTGVQALKTVLGRDDLDTFEAEWRAWVMTLER